MYALTGVNPSFVLIAIFSVNSLKHTATKNSTFQLVFQGLVMCIIWMKLITTIWIAVFCIIINGCLLIEAVFFFLQYAVAVDFSFKLFKTPSTAFGWKWCIVIYLNKYICFWATHLPNCFSLIDRQLCFQTSHIIRSVTVNFVPYQFTLSEETIELWVIVSELESNIIEYYKFTLESVWLILSFAS